MYFIPIAQIPSQNVSYNLKNTKAIEVKMGEEITALFPLVFSKLFTLRTLTAAPPVLQVI